MTDPAADVVPPTGPVEASDRTAAVPAAEAGDVVAADPAAAQPGAARFPEPPPLEGHGPARIVAVCNQKGGVGKTTTTINLAAGLAELGRRVLLVDFDPQASLTIGLGIDPNGLELSVYDLVMDDGVRAADVLVKTGVDGVDLVPSDIELSGAEVQLVSEVGREGALTRALADVTGEYDFVLIDCQPSLGLLTVNALTAADGVIIPVECQYFALRGLRLLVGQTIRTVQSRINPRLSIDGILATMFDMRTNHAREILRQMVEEHGDVVFHTVIARTVRFPETNKAGQPITEYAPASGAAESYRQLTRELLARL